MAMFLTGILKQANSCTLSHDNNSHLATLISIPAASCCAFTEQLCRRRVIVQLRLALCVPTIAEVSGASQDGETVLLCLTKAFDIYSDLKKIIAIGISEGKHLLSGLYVILICISALTLTRWPTPVSHYLGL